MKLPLTLAVFAMCSGVAAQQVAAQQSTNLSQEQTDKANAEALEKLQGQWLIEKAERNGAARVGLLEESNYPSLYIENDIVRGTNKKGALHSNSGRAKISIDATTKPLNMDIVLQNDDPGATFLAIYKIEGNRLIIATNTPSSKREQRPGQFSTRLTAGKERATDVLIYQRVLPPSAGQKPPAKDAAKLTQDQRDAADAEGLKKLQGQWLFEKGQRNDNARVTLLEELIYPSLYIENDIVRGANKKGDLGSNSNRAKITIDPTTVPMTMEIVLQNDDPGATYLAIYKIEGNRLTIATNTSKRDHRPGQYTTRLTAGKERATDVLVYQRAVPVSTGQKPRAKVTAKLTQEQRDTANAEGLKKLQGQWLFEKGQRNDNARVVLLDELIYPALYIENDIVRGTNKKGELNSNSGRAKITIDPTTEPMTMDLILQNDNPGAAYLAIYKIEGNRLIIATNTSKQGHRPGQFSTKLTAGMERATDVLTYKHAANK